MVVALAVVVLVAAEAVAAVLAAALAVLTVRALAVVPLPNTARVQDPPSPNTVRVLELQVAAANPNMVQDLLEVQAAANPLLTAPLRSSVPLPDNRASGPTRKPLRPQLHPSLLMFRLQGRPQQSEKIRLR